MNEHDIVYYGWDWCAGDAEPTEPVHWYAVKQVSLASIEASMEGGIEALFLRLRNGQIIRVKLKEQHV